MLITDNHLPRTEDHPLATVEWIRDTSATYLVLAFFLIGSHAFTKDSLAESHCLMSSSVACRAKRRESIKNETHLVLVQRALQQGALLLQQVRNRPT